MSADFPFIVMWRRQLVTALEDAKLFYTVASNTATGVTYRIKRRCKHWTCNVVTQVGHAAWTCNMDMQHGYMNMEHGHAPWACSMDVQRWHAEWTCNVDMHLSTISMTCSMDV
jgi:hypothetical protein